MPRLLNTELMRNPYNWAVVGLMIGISLIAITVIRGSLGGGR